MIKLENVSKIYPSKRGEVRALDGVTLHLGEGEFVLVRGPSGAGKSTLLLTLGGMIQPTAGRVQVLGQDLYALSSQGRANFRAYHIGFVFQLFHLVPYLSVLENVLLPTRLLPEPNGRQRALDLLDRFGMADRVHHRPAQLSTGERQRTAIARALVNRPRLLLADEPTGNLDPETGAQILQHLADFNREGGTVVVVSHSPVVEKFAHRTLYLRSGKLQTSTD